MADSLSEAHEARKLIERCLTGDSAASRQFQEQYGQLIYGYPLRVYRMAPEAAGDFYVYAFDNRRIFRRLRTFEGRAPLRAYLLGSVLDHLVLEWKRGEREIETVSIEGLSESSVIVAGYMNPTEADEENKDQEPWSDLLAQLEPGKAVVMKLLHVEDYELTPPEIRHIAKVSGRGVRDVMAGVDRLRATVRERESALKRLQDALDGVHAWIQLYERRLQRIAEDLSCLPPAASGAERLREERAQLQHKIHRRREQRAKLLNQTQRRKVTAPYKDIAALLNTSIGNVASQIARLRQDLQFRLRAREAAPETGGSNG